jgi:phage gp29-like protein
MAESKTDAKADDVEFQSERASAKSARAVASKHTASHDDIPDHENPSNLLEAAERGVFIAQKDLDADPSNKALKDELVARKASLEKVKNS